MDIRERILLYLENKGISKYKFYQKIGVSNGFLDKNGSIGSDKCEKISYQYPDINIEWLITGRGNMLIDSFEENMIKEPQVFYQKKEKEVESERIQELKETIATQREFIDFLKRKIDRLEDAQGAEVADAG